MDSLSIEAAAHHFYEEHRHPDIVGTGCGKNEIYVYIKKTLNIDLPKTYLGFQVIVRKTGEIRAL